MTNNEAIIIESFALTHLKFGVKTALNYGGMQIANLLTDRSSIDDDKYKGYVPNSNPVSYPDARSQLNTPVFDSLIIAAGEYVDTTFGLTKYSEMRLDTVLITLSQANNVILTPIQGRDGEVVEYSSKQSFRINIKGGVFSNVPLTRPSSEINNLHLMLGSNQPLVIKSSGILGEWEINEMFILDKNIPQMAGGYNYQLFEINCIQNLPVVLAQQQAQ